MALSVAVIGGVFYALNGERPNAGQLAHAFVAALGSAGIVPDATRLDVDGVYYATTDAPDSFANAFSRSKFEAIVAYDAVRVLAARRRA